MGFSETRSYVTGGNVATDEKNVKKLLICKRPLLPLGLRLSVSKINVGFTFSRLSVMYLFKRL